MAHRKPLAKRNGKKAIARLGSKIDKLVASDKKVHAGMDEESPAKERAEERREHAKRRK